MNSVRQASWALLLLIALACSGWYFVSSSPQPILDTKTLAGMIDLSFENLAIQQFNSQGQLAHRLETPHVHHIPNNDTNIFDKPHIVIRNANQTIWEINADKATALHGNAQITFSNNVLIQENPTANTAKSTFKTDKIVYYPKKQVAKTDREITYSQPGATIHATGMKAYLADKKIQLLSHARGTYETKHS